MVLRVFAGAVDSYLKMLPFVFLNPVLYFAPIPPIIDSFIRRNIVILIEGRIY